MPELERVLIGTIGRPHGLRGEVAVRLRTDEPERRFAKGAAVTVGSASHVVARTRWHGAILLVTFRGVADRTAAQLLQGEDVWADVPALAPADGEDEYYDRHLVGLSVRDASGATVGTVVEVLHLPAQDCLAVDVAGQRRLVPFVTELVPTVDMAAGYLQVADVAGLLEDLP